MRRTPCCGSTTAITAGPESTGAGTRSPPSWGISSAPACRARSPRPSSPGEILDIFELELEAEEAFQSGDPQRAVGIVQGLIDKHIRDEADKRWYMQEMARY